MRMEQELDDELCEVIDAIVKSGCWLGGTEEGDKLLLALLDAHNAFPSCPVLDEERNYYMA